MKTILATLMVLLLAQNAFSEECNTTLKESDSYQDLSIILNCLSRKIEALDKEVKRAKPESASSSEDNRSAVLLDNKFITVFDLRASKKNNTLLVSFVIKSKYDKDILLSILQGSPIMVDEFGDSTNRYDATGLRDLYKGNHTERDYTVLNPGVPTPVSIRFDSDKLRGKEFSLRVGLLHLMGEKPAEYSFGKTKIRIEQ